ncbi:zinc finger protein 679-like [Zerene cesonia]|uniref:zinc finger protein 679-like n=1 Tax=Zerene cesonia TaxID=33412 RepID=UPI0018E56410|nr:zinc finger protein 679-like [Zerene cesonia]
MEVLEEENPLETHTSLNKFNGVFNAKTNCAGRPATSKSIKFSEQPKSIISQMLIVEHQVINNMKSKHNIIQENSIETHKQGSIKKNCQIDKDVLLYSCADCSYSTKVSSNLTKHKRTHSQQKLYLCDQCTFSTKFSNSLNVHKRLHSNEKPFYCQYCEYRCNSSSNLKKHRSHRHLDKIKMPKTLDG